MFCEFHDWKSNGHFRPLALLFFEKSYAWLAGRGAKGGEICPRKGSLDSKTGGLGPVDTRQRATTSAFGLTIRCLPDPVSRGGILTPEARAAGSAGSWIRERMREGMREGMRERIRQRIRQWIRQRTRKRKRKHKSPQVAAHGSSRRDLSRAPSTTMANATY